MRMRVAVAGCFAVALGLQAQTAEVEKIVQTNRGLPEYRKAAEQQFAAFEAGLSKPCQDVMVNWSESHARLLRRGQLLKDGQLDGTQWEESVPGRACGEARAYRVLVVLHDGQGQMQPLLPGDGWSGPLLQHDTMLQVNAAAAAYTHQNCPVDVVKTHLSSENPEANPKAPWQEVWSVHSCGKHFGVPITFIPDKVGSGTSMTVSSKDIAALP